MILARGTASIAVWHFSLKVPTPLPSFEKPWEAAIAATGEACRLLSKLSLLTYPMEVESFFGVGPSYPPSQTRSVDAEGDLAASLTDLAAAGGYVAGDLRVDGRAEVHGVHASRLLDDVVRLKCVVAGFDTYLSLSTRSDIWMPYNLMAQPQSEVAELNAPRLRAALEAIEQIVGKPGYAEDSRFAKVDGYELRNHIVRGDVLDLQDMGYDESWIADRWPEPDPPDLPPGPAST
ncbi:MAG: hypothetical protein KBG48_00760 [Kofleriaceae bacterium]|jgi:hypothetical protein|nr:hypothetical protein [Kofleriaceae bacterium]MBP9165874.1 hypothetical protein [Kofleriaceae bacterium]MBP9862485.1 hypothetical protein [Kofleriaceae bacterium]